MSRCGRSAIALLCLLACACSSPDRPRLPSIVLITIDTLRTDHCSFDGYERQTTPFLDELADRSTVFERAYSTSSWTAPSMASIFTSLPPRSHGVVFGLVSQGKVINQDYLADDFTTLAEVLSAHGYETFGISTNAHLTSATGFAQGFTAFTELWFPDASVATTETLKFADRLKASDRYFLWVHYFDPHRYDEREPWYGDYHRDGRDLPRKPIVPKDLDPAAFVERLEEMVDRYDSTINYMDHSLRQLFSELNLESGTVVIVTSDHGEAFQEHGTLLHGKSLFEEEIRVPLIVRLPGQTDARRVDSAVSILDLYPTILDAAGIDVPPGLAGMSLLPVARGAPGRNQVIVTQLDRVTNQTRALTWEGWKLYMRLYKRKGGRENSVRLFDLQNDPGERDDVSGKEVARVKDLQRRWARWSKRWPLFKAPRHVPSFGKDQLDRLRALGYLGDE